MNKRLFLRQLESALGEADVIDAAAIAKIDALLWVLYPSGVKPDQYADVVRAVRVLDRLCVAAQTSVEPAAEEAVVQAVEDETTAPISTNASPPAPDGVGARPWTSLGEFSLSKTSSERRSQISHYTERLEPPVTGDDDDIVIIVNPSRNVSNG